MQRETTKETPTKCGNDLKKNNGGWGEKERNKKRSNIMRLEQEEGGRRGRDGKNLRRMSSTRRKGKGGGREFIFEPSS